MYGVNINSSNKCCADGSNSALVSAHGSSKNTAQNKADTFDSNTTDPKMKTFGIA